MKYLPNITAVFLFFLLATPPVFAQTAGKEWEALNKEIIELYQAGKYDRAVVVSQKAIEVAEKNAGPDHPSVAASLDNLAGLYGILGRYAKAEPLYKRALEIAEKALGSDHPKFTKILENLTALYRATNRDQEAEKLEQRVARIQAIKR